MLHSINKDQKLFVLKSGNGFSCLGFDVAHNRTTAYADWLKRPDLLPPSRKGTKRAYSAYTTAQSAVFEHYRKTGNRCPAELTPALIGLEGKRVEVIAPSGYKNRFWVGKSTGWIPCHLEIKTRRSSGGCAAYVPEGSTVRVIHAD